MLKNSIKKLFSTLKIENPYTFETVAQVPYDSYSASVKKLENAVSFQSSYKSLLIPDRISILSKALQYFEDNKSEIAKEITDQMGKPYKQSLKEVTSMIQVSKSLSTQAEHSLASEIIEDSESGYKKIIKEPIGPVFLLSPYNYPLLSVIGSLVPAILSGNPVIIKPSPYTPLSAKRFSAAFKEAGNELLVQDSLLHTKDISQILQNPNINYVHLVGHSETGRTLYREIAHKSFIDIGLFLSSNNGVYVSDDCNIGSAVLQIIKSSMDNSGQSSYRYSRVFVHKSKYEEFLSTAEPLIMSYSIGDPMDEATSLGPITEPDTIDLLAKSLEDAASAGGQIVCGGNAVNDENGKGRFFEPTLLTGVDDSFPIMRCENFGPVLIVDSVENDEEAVRRINGTEYGLIGGVFCEDKERVDKMVSEINAGTVLVNSIYSPDGRLAMSGRKSSGRNVLYSGLSYRHFYRTKSVQARFNL